MCQIHAVTGIRIHRSQIVDVSAGIHTDTIVDLQPRGDLVEVQDPADVIEEIELCGGRVHHDNAGPEGTGCILWDDVMIAHLRQKAILIGNGDRRAIRGIGVTDVRGQRVHLVERGASHVENVAIKRAAATYHGWRRGCSWWEILDDGDLGSVQSGTWQGEISDDVTIHHVGDGHVDLPATDLQFGEPQVLQIEAGNIVGCIEGCTGLELYRSGKG